MAQDSEKVWESEVSAQVPATPTVKAAGLIGLSAFLYSTVPLSIARLGIASPFLFMTAWLVGRVTVLWAILLFAYPRYFLDGEVWRLAWQHCQSWTMFFWVAAALAYVLFALSAGLIEVSVTTVLYEIRLALLIVFTGWLFRKEARYRRTGATVYFGLAIAVVGAAVVVMSQGVAWRPAILGHLVGAFDLESAVGLLLALGAAVFAAMSAFGLRWAVRFAAELPNVPAHSARSREFFGVFMGTALNSLLAAPIVGMIALARSEQAEWSALALSLLAVPALDIAATAAWRLGNLMTERLSVNVLLYFTPILSVLLLLLFGPAQDVDLPVLFIGAAIIIGANTVVFVATRDRT